MPVPFLLAALLLTASVPPVSTGEPEASTQAVTMRPTTDWIVLRVGGDSDAQTTFSDGVYTSGKARIDTPLPVGYPPPTAPGAIELKRYPIVRRAEFSSSGPADMGMNVAFWPLFKHIQRRDIEMTSPVEMDYRGMEDGTPDGWTMSFLYRERGQGPTGRDGLVTVEDAPALTVVAFGMTASYSSRNFAAGMAELDAWLASQTAWERDGDPRAMHYNGPDVRPQDRWMEVQIPVRTRLPDPSRVPDRRESGEAEPARTP